MSHPTIDLFWSFRSPYSYLATPGALAIAKDYQVEVRLRPVLPLAIRQPDFFSEENVKRAKYILVDWEREAEMLGMPHAWPSPDPIVQDIQTFTIADEQPYIFRLTCLGVEAQRRGRGIEFAAEVSRLIFGGTKDWHQGSHMANAAERAGLDLGEMEGAIREPTSHRDEIDANQVALEKAGHWGVPTFVFDNEPFFGQDRIATLRWRLDKLNARR
ncbi:MAG: 2-hydroxychromene-2-carboxylate isomerase [Marinobacter sp.]|uniref:2-hydroxychromene-2-carboxylate isomerase n=1 Tax=Marinobacter sp. TaxID=50741 RepID=UPI003C5AAECD